MLFNKYLVLITNII